MEHQLLNTALHMIDLGWSIVPVKRDKTPFIAWREFQDRKATKEEVTEWFQKYDDCQIAVVTGEISNLLIVDVEKDGNFDLIKDETFTVKSGGDGRHYYFQYDPDLPNKIDRIIDLVDLKSNKGICHTFGSSNLKGSYDVIKNIPIAKMSAETKKIFLDAVEKAEKEKVEKLNQFNNSHVLHSHTKPDDYTSISAELISSYSPEGEGGRNDSLTRFAGKVLKRIHPVHWDTEGFNIINQANYKNVPPLPMWEVNIIFKSIKEREAIATPADRYLSQPKESAPMLIKMTEEEKDELSDEILHVSEVAERQPIDTSFVYRIDDRRFDEPLGGGIFPGDLVVIAAGTGAGKTTFAQDLALRFVRGGVDYQDTSFIPNYDGNKSPILVLSYEVLPTHLWAQFQAMGATKNDKIYMPENHITGKTDWVLKKIEEAIIKFSIKIVVIDHLGYLEALETDELKKFGANYSTYVTKIVKELKQITKKHGVVIIMPVHIKKTGKKDDIDLDDVKDSGGINQEADLVFLLYRERAAKNANAYYTDYTRIMLAKNRHTGGSAAGWYTLKNSRFFDSTHLRDIDEFEKSISKNKEVEKINGNPEAGVQGVEREIAW